MSGPTAPRPQAAQRARPGVSVRSSLPGRVRRDVAALVGNRALAPALAAQVRRMEAVTAATPNPASGSLLVTYDHRRAATDLPAVLAAELEAWLAQLRRGAITLPTAAPRALSRILKVARRHRTEGRGPVLLSLSGYAVTDRQSVV